MITAILACGGKGERFGSKLPKQFLPLLGLPVYLYSLFLFERNPKVECVVVVCPKDFRKMVEEDVKKHKLDKVISIVYGGKTRQESVYNGVKASPEDTQYFLVHDAVRPCLSMSLLERVVNAMFGKNAVIPVIPCRDALAKVENGRMLSPIDRTSLCLVQTPQGIKAECLRISLEKAERENRVFPDEGSLLLFYGYEVYTVEGELTNLKITYQEDFKLAEIILKGKIGAENF